MPSSKQQAINPAEPQMGIKNYLIEGGSCTGKTTLCDELQRRGHHAIHADRELAYQGDPKTGAPLDGFVHAHHIWDIDKVKSLIADQSNPMTFFCGGSRNFQHFINLFDKVFILNIDINTLNQRLAARPKDQFGAKPSEQKLITHLHTTKTDLPNHAITINATAPIKQVATEILCKCGDDSIYSQK